MRYIESRRGKRGNRGKRGKRGKRGLLPTYPARHSIHLVPCLFVKQSDILYLCICSSKTNTLHYQNRLQNPLRCKWKEEAGEEREEGEEGEEEGVTYSISCGFTPV